MARTILTALALAAILATAACNSSVTGPAFIDENTVADQGGDRTPDVFEDPDVIAPEEGGSGGGTPARGAYNQLRQRRIRVPGDLAPVDGENSGGGEATGGHSGLRRRHGSGEVSPE
jgi:hypothetical protein